MRFKENFAVLASAVLTSQYTFTSWLPALLLKNGQTVVHSLLYTTIMMAGAPVGALIGSSLVDSIGRKKTIVSTLFLASVFAVLYGYQTNNLAIIFLGFLLTTAIYILIASVIGIYVSELFSTSFRFQGAGIANAVGKLLTVLTPALVVWITSQFQVIAIYYLIVFVLVLAGIVVGFWGPETKQRDIQ